MLQSWLDDPEVLRAWFDLQEVITPEQREQLIETSQRNPRQAVSEILTKHSRLYLNREREDKENEQNES